MSDFPSNSSEQVARDYQQQVYNQLVHDMRPSTAPSSSSKPMLGGGLGNVAGWMVAAGMVGAVVGGILGQGLMGAIVGALVFGGALWALGTFAGSSDSGVSRMAVLRYVMYGAAAGVAMAFVMALEYPNRLSNLLVNWTFLGVLVGGFYGLRKRSRG